MGRFAHRRKEKPPAGAISARSDALEAPAQGSLGHELGPCGLTVGRRIALAVGQNVQGETMQKSNASPGQPAPELISNRIAELGDWRGETLGRMRQLIQETDPDVVEEWKWRGTPVWSHDGIICTGETYKTVVKLTFAKGAALEDPMRLFNSSLEGNVRRAIDIHEGEQIDESAFKALVRAAIALNTSKAPKKAKP
jgi:hypothetical protein